MKKVLMTILLSSVLSAINPLLAQATFPGEKIIFGNRGQSNDQNNEALVKAYNLATQKNYEQALTLINEEIKVSPKLATLYVIKGLVLNEMGSYLLANSALNQVLSFEGRHPGIQYGFCSVYRNLGMSESSLQACRIAEEMHILSPEAHYEYAQTLIATGEMELANKSLSAAAKLAPNKAQYHYEKGMNFYYLNQYDDAENSFQKALSIDSTDVDSAYQLAYIYAARKKETLAKQQIEKVLKIRKEHPKIQSAKLLLEYVKKNVMEKLPLKIIPHEYHLGRSTSFYKSEKYGLALIEIETATKLKPDDMRIKEIFIGLTGFLLRISKTEKAIKEMISLLGETDIMSARGYQELGDIEVIRGNLSKARTYYEKALKSSDPNGIARQTLDELPEKPDPTTTPLQQTEVFIDPSLALNRKGELFAQHKMHKRAISLYMLASSLKPNYLPFKLNTATAYYNSENYGKAISILERLLLSYPSHKNMLTHRILLAQAYLKSDNRGKSLKNIEIAIKINPAAKNLILTNPVFEILNDMKEYKKLTQ
jgi:tetratricopeptide (TPR) repeat protein